MKKFYLVFITTIFIGVLIFNTIGAPKVLAVSNLYSVNIEDTSIEVRDTDSAVQGNAEAEFGDIQTTELKDSESDSADVDLEFKTDEKITDVPNIPVIGDNISGPDIQDEGRTQNNESDIEFLKDRASTVSIKAVEVRGWDAEKKEELLKSVKEHAEVRSGQDLENFATGVLIKDENVKKIEVSNKEVKIDYRMPAKFLGIFKTSIRTTAEVDTAGKVKVKFPWFGFLFNKPVSASGIEKDIQKELDKTGNIKQENEKSSFEKAANALNVLSNIMKAKHDTAKAAINNVR